MKAKIILLSALAASTVLFTACEEENSDHGIGSENMTISTPRTTAVSSTEAVLSTTLSVGSGAHFTGVGYCIGSEANPDIYGTTYEAEYSAELAFGGTKDKGEITLNLTNLAPNTEYHVRAYVSVYKGSVMYSPDFVFTTTEGTINEELAAYKGPSYPDYYIDLAGWDQRDKWNLANVHDPSVVKADDGYFYMYQTDASYGNAHTAGGHFHGRRSQDLVNWEYLGGTMASLPEWVVPKLNEIRAAQGLEAVNPDVNAFGYWAPVVRKVKSGLYRMYYSIVVPGYINGPGTWGERSFIGMMENTNPANNDGWVDKGFVITSSSDLGPDAFGVENDWANCPFKFNAIDPGYVETDNGEHWLVYGSWHSGIAAVQINVETGKPENLGDPWNDNANYGQLIATRQMGNRWQAAEGPEIIYRDGYYYLFLAYDALGVPYNTRVVRSTSITGPYLGIDGTDVTNNGGDAYPILTHPYKFNNSPGWVGISHCAVFDDGNGNWYYASQGRLPEGYLGNEFSNSIMLGHVRAIRWTKDGWPVVMPERYGAVPEVPITEEELTGTWEHIDLAYNYGQQDASAKMVLTLDNKVSDGVWKGADWSYDAENQILTIDGVDLYLSRECDWETEGRPATIVYAGVSGTKTFWGKKSR